MTLYLYLVSFLPYLQSIYKHLLHNTNRQTLFLRHLIFFENGRQYVDLKRTSISLHFGAKPYCWKKINSSIVTTDFCRRLYIWYEYNPRLSAWNSNKIAIVLFASTAKLWGRTRETAEPRVREFIFEGQLFNVLQNNGNNPWLFGL